MKYKHKIERRDSRRAWFDKLSNKDQAALTRPGSQKKK